MIQSFNPRLPRPPADSYQLDLNKALHDLFRETMLRIDTLAYGHLEGVKGKGTAAPTTGTWAQGDYIRNTTPVEAGSAGSKYWIRGWWCEVGGTPGTWKQDRGLTGN